jgi:hypothetical protein
MANDNFVNYHTGLVAAGYWFAAGPGREPHSNASAQWFANAPAACQLIWQWSGRRRCPQRLR